MGQYLTKNDFLMPEAISSNTIQPIYRMAIIQTKDEKIGI